MLEPGTRDYGRLYQRLLRTMLVACLLPLLLMGGAAYLQFQRYARQMVVDQQERLVLNHAESINSFLRARRAELRAITEQYDVGQLGSGELERVFKVLQQGAGVYTDIGIIDDRGNHVKYVGPYNLAGRNYSDAPWFEELKTKDVVVSDLFLGYRAVPHFIIAVKRADAGSYWILRATLSTDYISQLVESIRVGTSGEAFLLDRSGRFQTKTRFPSNLLGASNLPFLQLHTGVHSRELRESGVTYLYSDVWTAADQWLLVFRQDKAEAFTPLSQALLTFSLITLAGLAGVGIVAAAISKNLVRYLRAADAEAESLHAQLVQSSKMAAIGEMAAGVAHEINNPLGNIEALRTWILDLVTDRGVATDDVPEVVDSAKKIGDQVERCRRITHDLLKFSRRVESERLGTDLNGLLKEMIQMVEHRARAENIRLELDSVPLPELVASPSKLQQIALNILNNAVDAMEGPGGTVTIRTRKVKGQVEVEFSDTGCGIPEENLAKIFEPFFTTKPVGKGTGLGLAVCYGLAQQMGGSLSVRSRPGAGTTFTLRLPLAAPSASEAPPRSPSAAPGQAAAG